MSASSKKDRIREALATLVTTHSQAVSQIEEAIRGLTLLLEIEALVEPTPAWTSSQTTGPQADRQTHSIVWRNKSCFLGNTLPFLFFERLARSPRRYVSHADLLDDVWGGDRHTSTIRGVVKRLRDRLQEEGMGEVAAAIDGSVSGYYGLKPV
ncbi:winged helix-turn-helix domain-containing protein [Aeoliella sp. SH292]|uniref:winged helix-turn-helix domain-containing protein n=1 Tax=Aeoliella sp. SH292 TaxID=3454464 RepID=UPI003F96EDB6